MNKLLSLSLIPLAATATVASVMMASAPAKAISFSLGGTSVSGSEGFLTTSVAGATVNTFDDPTPIITGVYTDGGIVGPGTDPGQFATPAGNTSKYFSVGPSTSTPATIKASGRAWNYFGLYWGSIDRYNFIEFFKNGISLAKFSGSDIVSPANGNQFRPNTNEYVNFFSGGGGFDEIQFSSVLDINGNEVLRNAFESDNHAFREVPEPLTILGTGLALGLGGLFKSKQSKKQSLDA